MILKGSAGVFIFLISARMRSDSEAIFAPRSASAAVKGGLGAMDCAYSSAAVIRPMGKPMSKNLFRMSVLLALRLRSPGLRHGVITPPRRAGFNAARP